ncbi:FtsX-like permease family protein, partial [Georgenia subflava]
ADPGTRAGGGRLRRWSAVVLTVTGAAMLAGAVGAALLTDDSDMVVMLALAVGILGGMLSFAGVMVGAVFVVPQAVRAVGAAAAAVSRRARATVGLATVNARRNPRRTSATATALVIGVALVTMMATGAGSARASLDATLDSTFPVDVMVGTGDQALTAAQISAVGDVDGVAEAVAVRRTHATVGDGGSAVEAAVVGLDPAGREVLRDAALVAGLGDDTVVIGADLAEATGTADGERVPVAGVDGSTELTVRVLPDGGWTSVVTPATTAILDQDAAVTQVWARLAADAPAGATIQAVQDAVAEVSDSAAPFVTGAAVEREGYTQIIDTLLAIVIGLLGVAVVIALIGVANTLSLSVIERRHEHALLRAVGMTRGQLRGTLVVEGLLIAAVGTGLGMVLGLLYGWAGSAVLLGGTGGLALVVPWPHLGAVAVVALVAGLAASVLPARSAVRTPP